jgi:hypothetical protein
MIFYGFRERSLPLAELGSRPCPHCGVWQEFRAHVKYTYIHIYWVFGFVVKRTYFIACDHCDLGTLVRRDEIGVPLEDDPIPFHHRWGMPALLVTVFGTVAYLLLNSLYKT